MNRIFYVAILCFISSVTLADVMIPPPNQLVNMNIKDRLDLYGAIAALPTAERDQKMTALRQEIDSLSPQQKQLMQDHFKAEYQSLSPMQQSELKRQRDSLDTPANQTQNPD